MKLVNCNQILGRVADQQRALHGKVSHKLTIFVEGSVYATTSLVNWTGPTGYNLSIQVTDYTMTAGPEVLTITLTDLKTKPQLLDLDRPIKITIPEDAVAGSSIFQVGLFITYILVYSVIPK